MESTAVQEKDDKITRTLPKVLPLSFSSMNRYGQCAFSLYCRKSGFDKIDNSIWSKSGRAVHGFIDAYIRQLIAEADAEGLTGEMLEPDFGLASEILYGILNTVPVQTHDEVREMCLTFAYTFEDIPRTAMTEVYAISDASLSGATLSMDEEPGIDLDDTTCSVLHGYIDMLVPPDADGVANFYDWKTGWQIMSRADAENDLQLRTYALLVFLAYPESTTVNANLFYFRYGRCQTVTFEREMLDKLRGEVLSVLRQIENDTEFTATPGQQCARCEYYHHCPEYLRTIQNPAEVPPKLTADIATRLANEQYILKRRLKDVDDALRAFADIEGAIKTAGGTLGYTETGTRDYGRATPTIVKRLKQHGINNALVMSVLTTSKSKVQTLLDAIGKPEIWKEIEHDIPVTPGTSFRSKKVKAKKKTA